MLDIPFLRENDFFPHANEANEEGIVAYGGNLEPMSLINAYRGGIFPWYAPNDPIIWWSPNPRCIMLPQDFIIRKSLGKRIRNGGFEIKFDHNFLATIKGCREVDGRAKNGTWIIQDMIDAYKELHRLGFAHSIECYLDGELVGGLYGVCLGSAFFGESMFSKVPDASKVAYAALVDFALEKNFKFIDCQMPTDHLLSLGAICVERDLFLEMLNDSLEDESIITSWASMSPK